MPIFRREQNFGISLRPNHEVHVKISLKYLGRNISN